jgi:hypothetical protein
MPPLADWSAISTTAFAVGMALIPVALPAGCSHLGSENGSAARQARSASAGVTQTATRQRRNRSALRRCCCAHIGWIEGAEPNSPPVPLKAACAATGIAQGNFAQRRATRVRERTASDPSPAVRPSLVPPCAPSRILCVSVRSPLAPPRCAMLFFFARDVAEARSPHRRRAPQAAAGESRGHGGQGGDT